MVGAHARAGRGGGQAGAYVDQRRHRPPPGRGAASVERPRGAERRRRCARAQTGAAAIAATAQREATAALLLRYADTAMYAAKGAGKSRAVLADGAASRTTNPAGTRCGVGVVSGPKRT